VKVSIIPAHNLGQVIAEEEYETPERLAEIITKWNWAPGRFAHQRRTLKNFLGTDLLALDVDEGCSLEDAKNIFAEYRHIIAPSRNHQKEKNGIVCDRFRVVLFLSKEVTNEEEYSATWEAAFARWGFIDRACKDASRFFYRSPEVTSINGTGSDWPVSMVAEPHIESVRPKVQAVVEKGDLWKSTLALLANGAPAGTRHTELVKAVANMRDNNYSLDEVIERLEEMSLSSHADWTQPGLSPVDIKTIERVYARETKPGHGFVEKPENAPSIIVNASELLGETFSYLADKDKVKGEPTGIEGLDKLLGGGFRTGELTVLMAQAKTGKNTLYHWLIYKQLMRGLSFGYASRELSPATEVIPNLLSIALGRNTWTADITSSFQDEAREALATWQLYFAPGYGHFEPDEIETWMRTLKDLGVNHFLFDHFHYALAGEDYDQTAKLIKRLKTLTKQLDVHLSLIVQPRSLREGEQLSLATLRGGAAIGQALDNLLILERHRGEQWVSRLKVEQVRHKLARTGDLYLKYNPEDTSFEEVDKVLIVEPQQHAPQPHRPWAQGARSASYPRV